MVASIKLGVIDEKHISPEEATIMQASGSNECDVWEKKVLLECRGRVLQDGIRGRSRASCRGILGFGVNSRA